MRRTAFLKYLKTELDFLRTNEKEEVLKYYDEMIQDAVEGGESEEIFIMNLGEVEDIAKNIREDASLRAQIREKVHIDLRAAFDLSVRLIGYFFFGVLAFVVVTTGFSFLVSGFAAAVHGLFMMATEVPTGSLLLFRIGEVALGIGLVILAIGMFQWFFHTGRNVLQKLLEQIRSWIR
ncbi:MAG: DUF1700 domain-containing protein [Candidatus Izemoplasmatales bacterium]|nr:DUF1700 domain-containing protein [Candidatus Izemoplasmatales bacterium]